MFEPGRVLFLYAEEKLHPGKEAGPDDDVDQPIQRSVTTGFLSINANAVRRMLREPFRSGSEDDKKTERAIFGSILGARAGDFSDGILSTSDAQVLLLPVAFGGRLPAPADPDPVFVWTTCPLQVAELRRGLVRIGVKPDQLPPDLDGQITGSDALVGAGFEAAQHILLLGTSVRVRFDERVAQLAGWLRAQALPQLPAYGPWQDRLAQTKGNGKDKIVVWSGIVVVNERLFGEFCRSACPVEDHVMIEPESGTVRQGALWREEDIPQDALMFAAVQAEKPRSDAPDNLKQDGALKELARRLSQDTLLQLGGGQGTGKGYVRMRWYPDVR